MPSSGRFPAVAACPVRVACLLVACLLATPVTSASLTATEEQHSRLQAQHRQHVERQAEDPQALPLTIDSSRQSGRLDGVIQAELAQPLEAVGQLLGSADGWCDVMVLLPNIRSCEGRGDSLRVQVARRFDQPVADTRQLDLALRTSDSGGDLLQARIEADEGPLGTSNYRIFAQAIAVGDGRTFIRLDYGYDFGFGARTAASIYLSTSGRDKVGFSIVGHENGKPQFIDGLRGAVERNAMRLHLAIDARLQVADRPAPQRHEAALRHWLQAIDEHSRQLAEDDPDAYLAAKRERVEDRRITATD